MEAQKPILPNDRFKEGVVIASVIWSDEGDRDEWTLLIMNRVDPFYTVLIYDRVTEQIGYSADHYNIVPAVEDYQDAGGDY